MKKILSMTFVLVSLLSMFALAGNANAASISRSSYLPGRSGAAAAKPWRVLSSANPSPGGDYLYAVAALSATNAWSVGDYLAGSGKTMVDQTLIEHYDGASWSVVPSPDPGTGPNGNYLRAIAAVSTSDIYAVGSEGGVGALIEHFDGTSWSVMANPGVGVLRGIVAISAHNIWAVGDDGGPTRTLIEHYNGSTWSVVPGPNFGLGPGDYNELSGIAAISASNIYAVGYYSTGSNSHQTFIVHYNGSQWSIIPSPNVSGTHDYLTGVTAISASNIYAVGGSYTLDSAGKALIEHFDGQTWSIVLSSSPYTLSSLNAVQAASASNIYAAGYSFTGTPTIPGLVEHYNGRAWKVVASPNPGGQNFLNGLARIPGTGQFIAVGNEDGQTLVECNC